MQFDVISNADQPILTIITIDGFVRICGYHELSIIFLSHHQLEKMQKNSGFATTCVYEFII